MKAGVIQSMVAPFTVVAVLLFFVSLASAQTAASVYKAKCAMCHGADGKGTTSAGKAMGVHDFSSDTVQKMSDEELANIISKGKNKMPSYGNKLKGPEIKDLATYVRELGKSK